MSFERVGIARYARCERLLAAAPSVLGDRWEDLPAELRGRWVRMLTHCRRARLLAYRVVSLQSSGRIQPGDAAAYRIAVTKLDQDSAEVLMDIAAEVSPDDPGGRWFLGEAEDHWRTRRRRRFRPAASRCNASCCPEPCWRRNERDDSGSQRGRQRVWATGASGVRGRRRRPACPAGRSQTRNP